MSKKIKPIPGRMWIGNLIQELMITQQYKCMFYFYKNNVQMRIIKYSIDENTFTNDSRVIVTNKLVYSNSNKT